MAACRKEATSSGAFGITGEQRIDRDVLNRCMERRGYTVRPVERSR